MENKGRNPPLYKGRDVYFYLVDIKYLKGREANLCSHT